MTRSSPLLQITNLHVAFATDSGRREVVHGIDLKLERGEILGLVGESGSGKSVTAQAIIGLLGTAGKMTQGEIFFDGERLDTKTLRELQHIRGKKIGMVFQDPMRSLNPTVSIGRQIAEMLVVHDRLSRRKAQARALELLAEVGIAEPDRRYHAYPFQLSGGMCQRVMIAIALACRPLLLIADEPTTALDVTIQAQILELLQAACRDSGMSLLLITHDLGIVAGSCDRAAVMQHGRIVEMAAVENLFAAPCHPYTQALLAARAGMTDAKLTPAPDYLQTHWQTSALTDIQAYAQTEEVYAG